MNSNFVNILFLMVGIIFGVILAISIDYPFEIKDLEQAKKICQNQQVKSVKINIAGNIKVVECENLTVFKLN